MAECTYLDRLIRPTRNQSRPGHIKRRAEHASLCLERPGLGYIVHVLEGGAGVVVPKCERAIVTY